MSGPQPCSSGIRFRNLFSVLLDSSGLFLDGGRVDYDLNARKRLGRAVRRARRAAGLAKTAEWADKVGRSDRVLLGMERGEPAGPDTYAAVAEALGWPTARIYDLLEDRADQPPVTGTEDDESGNGLRARIESAPELDEWARKQLLAIYDNEIERQAAERGEGTGDRRTG